MQTVIRVENVSKLYRLGTIGTGSLVHDLNRWWHVVRGKENPYSKVQQGLNDSPDNSYIWSLRDINFDVKQGEVVGIVGRNGAGKSTLLKILSRVTAPTSGTVKAKGRIASLLEVGTGFHPELTGIENIFLNGAILGMTKVEVRRKLDEIIDFSGIERFIETPVKRYSSGMYVRLAFAVAAHLEPEILIVDEVLAVGDADFQKKCLGKMDDVSKNQGRTVLFVSHSMSAVNALCQKGIFLASGKIVHHGPIEDVVSLYLRSAQENYAHVALEQSTDVERYGDRIFGEMVSISTLNERDERVDTFEFGGRLLVRLQIRIKAEVYNPEIGVCISTRKGSRLHHLVSKWERELGKLTEGYYAVNVEMPSIWVYPGEYTLTAWFRNHIKEKTDDYVEGALNFKVIKSKKTDIFQEFTDFSISGGVYAKSTWSIVKTDAT